MVEKYKLSSFAYSFQTFLAFDLPKTNVGFATKTTSYISEIEDSHLQLLTQDQNPFANIWNVKSQNIFFLFFIMKDFMNTFSI